MSAYPRKSRTTRTGSRWFPVALVLAVLLHGGAFARGPELTESEKNKGGSWF